MKSQVNRLEGGAKGDLQSKYASLLAFDYEAAARLKAWDSLDEIIKVCKPDCYFWPVLNSFVLVKYLNTAISERQLDTAECASRNRRTSKIREHMAYLQISRCLLKRRTKASSS